MYLPAYYEPYKVVMGFPLECHELVVDSFMDITMGITMETAMDVVVDSFLIADSNQVAINITLLLILNR